VKCVRVARSLNFIVASVLDGIMDGLFLVFSFRSTLDFLCAGVQMMRCVKFHPHLNPLRFDLLSIARPQHRPTVTSERHVSR